MIWRDGLNANPGVLSARAASLRSAHSRLESISGDFDSLEMGPWRGKGAQAERLQHRSTYEQTETFAAVTLPAAEALDDAFRAFTDLKSLQESLERTASRLQFGITDLGVVYSKKFSLSPVRAAIQMGLQASAVGLIAGLNISDGVLAVRLGAAGVQGAIRNAFSGIKNLALFGIEFIGDKLLDGLDWGWNAILDGAEWLAGKARDVFGWVADLDIPFVSALARFGESMVTPPKWLSELLRDGKVPQIAEVGASLIYRAGLGAGAIYEGLTGENIHLFDDGRPFAGEVGPSTSNAPGGQYHNIQDLMSDTFDLSEVKNDEGRNFLKIVPVTSPDDGMTRFVVHVPATSEALTSADGWMGAKNSGLDWPANLKGVGDGTTSATQGAMAATDKAIQHYMQQHPELNYAGQGKPELVLAGHSQGGIISANMAADDEFAEKYDIHAIVSAGSPQETIPVPAHTQVYNFVNGKDPVPHLDFDGFYGGSTPNMHNLVVQGTPQDPFVMDHAPGPYKEGIGEWLKSDGPMQRQLNGDLADYIGGGTREPIQIDFGRQ